MHHSGVICKFENCIGVVGAAVRCVEGEQSATLGGAGADRDGGGEVETRLDLLWAVGEKVLYPVAG